MARPWFKVATRIKDDPAMITMSGASFKAFIFILGLANERDEDGAVCDRKHLAMMLRMPEKVTTAALAEIGHRIVVDDDGTVRVRDWLQWQAPSRKPEPAEQVTERTRKFKERAKERSGNATVPDDGTQQERDGNGALELEGELDEEREVEQETEGTASAVAAPATAPEPDEPAPPKREPLGPGAKLFKTLTHANPNIEQRSILDAAYERHGPEKFESVIREWLRLGYRKQNADGMVNVMERGWTKRQPANGRGVLANGHGASPDEAAAIDQVIADGMADVAARLEAPASAPADADRLWRDVHAGIALRMPAATLKAWVDPIQVASFDGETLTLLAPTAAVHSWLTQRLSRELDEALADVAPGVDWVVVVPEAAAVGAAA